VVAIIQLIQPAVEKATVSGVLVAERLTPAPTTSRFPTTDGQALIPAVIVACQSSFPDRVANA
jgi:hypothetical protein